ncbi:DoxX family protein [Microbacterium sp. STN6]|uniref:DoxX family protein n=1 Tax=Microbacterium sp. STN6 TaxID=2995588 RepID=UPI00226082AD|nr:DoxX family protein [Microbacterium sp. STN6]MCX7523140.1 DoxX family protein [Microbacterium sp. STN6]
MTGWAIAALVLRILLALAFIGMGALHFLPASRRTMAAMIPPRLRFDGLLRPALLVAFTGVCEIAGGLGLLYPPTRLAAGICLAVFLVAVFPANAYAARRRDRFGSLAVPLVPRLVGQVVLIALCLVAALA